MTARPVAEFLVCFGQSDRRESEDIETDRELPDAEPAAVEVVVETVANSIEAARAEGYAEGRAAASAEHAEALAAERTVTEARLAADRARWASNEAGLLAEKLEAALGEIERRMGASVARILGPFVRARLTEKAVHELVQEVRVLFSGKDCALIEVTGPADLLDALRGKLGEASAAMRFVPEESVDVRIVADETRIDTRLAAWFERLEPNLW